MTGARARLVTVAGMAVILGSGLFAPGAARADCPGGARDLTPAEQEATTRVLAAIRDALPPAPAGWRIASESRVDGPRSVCLGGTPSLDWRVERRYVRTEGLRELDAEYRRKVADAERLTPEEQARVAELDRQLAELGKVWGPLAKSVRTQRLSPEERAAREAELKPVDEKMRRLQAERKAATQPWLANETRQKAHDQALEEATKARHGDTEAKVAVGVNQATVTLGPAVQPVQLPGVQLAYHGQPYGLPLRLPGQEVLTALLGSWRVDRKTPQFLGLKATITPSAYLKPQAIAVSIEASPERAGQLLEATKLDALKGLIR